MENTRPYWKVIVSLFFSITVTVLVVVLGVKCLKWFWPFVFGWIISLIARPIVCFLSEKLRFLKKIGAVIAIIIVLAVAVVAIGFGVSKLAQEVWSWISNLPEMYSDMSGEIEQAGARLPQETQNKMVEVLANIEGKLGDWVSGLGEPTIQVAKSVVKSIPSVFIGLMVGIVSSFFFVADWEEIIAWARKVSPKPLEERVSMVVYYLKHAVGGYFKAQVQIMLVVGIILFISFLIMDVNYAILCAILIAFLDFLPFFGTGTALLPWALFKAITGHYRMAVGLLIVYVISQSARQFIQPKLVGDKVGLKPLPTMVLLYLGYKVGSFWGMIFAVPIGMIIINMYKAGAFDYILDDVKILVDGVMKLRE